MTRTSASTATGPRDEAGLVAASVVVEARRMCDSGEFGQVRATVGTFDFGAGQTNVIPHEEVITVDLRNPADLMAATEQHLAGYVDQLAARHGVEVAWERMAPTSRRPRSALRGAMSGAGHDAQEIAAICPTARVVVAGEDGGISHTPRENSNAEACATGTDVLANAALRLAEQP